MPTPSPLSIASSSVLRLLKEEVSYHKELVDQEAQVKIQQEKIKEGHGNEDGNAEYMLKQQQRAADQTKAIFGPLKIRISDAVAKLEEQIALKKGSEADAKELEHAEMVLAQAQAVKDVEP